MTWEEYLRLFDQILLGDFTNELYEKPSYKEYVKMNHSRLHRWLKHEELEDNLIQSIRNISTKQIWYLITEPWCGDAAHSTPFIAKMAELNNNIELKIVLRDTNLEFMDEYLTNGGRSIPKLVVRDSSGTDLFAWGPRPEELSTIHAELKKNEAAIETIHKTLQNWYNQNKGVAIQKEMSELLKF